jgi:putative Holliday junction resolvase
MISECNAVEVIVGLPLNLSGSRTPSTENAIELAHEIAAATSASVRMIDERLTTVSAHAALRQVGKKQRGTRSVVDQVAAVMVLQHALDSERASGNLPGIALEDL